MEIITIDSSDDEDAVPPASAKAGGGRLLAASRDQAARRIALPLPRSVTQTSSLSQSTTQDQKETDDDDGDGSVSSADSIWEKSGLLQSSKSKPKRGVASRYKGDVAVDSDEELEVVDGRDSDSGRDTNDADIGIGGSATEARKQKKSDDSNVSSLKTREGVNEGRKQPAMGNSTDTTSESYEYENLEPTVDAWIGTWKVMLLMDIREFGQHKGSKFLQETENKINKHFGGVHCETLSLPSADYMFVARLISNTNGEVIDERVLNMIIERKHVNDMQTCLINKSKKYKPLSFFEAQMYKLQQCGIPKKLFLIEGDEDNPQLFSAYSGKSESGVASKLEQSNRLKRVKSMRLQIGKGEIRGIDVLSTKNKQDTVKFLIQQLESFKKSFNPLRPPAMTTESHKEHINAQMSAPTFREYLRQRSMKGIGHAKAMKVIMDPELDWDKNFNNDVFERKTKTKSTLADRALFWGESEAAAATRHLSNARAHASREKHYSGGVYMSVDDKDGNPSCSICRKTIDIWTETGFATCNQIAKCGKVFHESCLAAQGYNIGKSDGCILCKALSKFTVKSNGQASKRAPARKSKDNSKNSSAASLGGQDSSNGSNAGVRAQSKKNSDASKGKKSNATKSATAASNNDQQCSATATSRKKSASSKGRKTNTASPPTSTTPYLSASTNSNEKSEISKKRKRPIDTDGPTPEKLYIKRPKLNQQPARAITNSTTIDRNGCLSHPLRNIDKSVAAALFLSEETCTDSVRAVGSGKKNKNATSTKSTAAGKISSPSVATTQEEADVSCGICCEAIDVWVEQDIVLCNRVAACGGTFHEDCLTVSGYDIQSHDGCIKCEAKSKFLIKKTESSSKKAARVRKAAAKHDNDIVMLDTDDEEDDDVIVID